MSGSGISFGDTVYYDAVPDPQNPGSFTQRTERSAVPNNIDPTYSDAQKQAIAYWATQPRRNYSVAYVQSRAEQIFHIAYNMSSEQARALNGANPTAASINIAAATDILNANGVGVGVPGVGGYIGDPGSSQRAAVVTMLDSGIMPPAGVRPSAHDMTYGVDGGVWDVPVTGSSPLAYLMPQIPPGNVGPKTTEIGQVPQQYVFEQATGSSGGTSSSQPLLIGGIVLIGAATIAAIVSSRKRHQAVPA